MELQETGHEKTGYCNKNVFVSIHTDMCDALVHDKERDPQIPGRIPDGCRGNGDDLKGTVIHPASRASDCLGGAIIPVDGGYLVK